MRGTTAMAWVALLSSACGGSTSGGAPADGGAASGGSGGSSASGGTGALGGTGATGAVGGSGGSGAVGGSGATGGSGGGNPGVGQPPPPDPNAPPASGTAPTTLVIRRIFLGDTNPQGQPDAQAWRKYGLNVDGLVSTKASTNHCMPQKGATKSSIQTDGDNGIDNSFGSNLVKIIATLTPNPSDELNTTLDAGAGTWLFHLQNLGNGAAQNGVKAALFGAAPLGSAPSWSPTEVRPVTFESVSGGSITSPLNAYPQSYVVGGTWVGAPATAGKLALATGLGAATIRHVRAVATISGTGPSATATGVISGVIGTEEYITEFAKVAGQFSLELCNGATFESVAQAIRAASDIMQDGSNGDPSKTCDGISIGVGFEATAAMLGSVAPAVPPVPDPCK